MRQTISFFSSTRRFILGTFRYALPSVVSQVQPPGAVPVPSVSVCIYLFMIHEDGWPNSGAFCTLAAPLQTDFTPPRCCAVLCGARVWAANRPPSLETMQSLGKRMRTRTGRTTEAGEVWRRLVCHCYESSLEGAPLRKVRPQAVAKVQDYRFASNLPRRPLLAAQPLSLGFPFFIELKLDI